MHCVRTFPCQPPIQVKRYAQYDNGEDVKLVISLPCGSAGFLQKSRRGCCPNSPHLPPRPRPLPQLRATHIVLNTDSSMMNGGGFPWMASAFGAFYCFLHQPLWMTLYLTGQSEDLLAVDLHRALSNSRDKQLPAQLAAGACLTQVCVAEAVYLESDQDSQRQRYYLTVTNHYGSMATLVHIMDRAIKVRLRAVFASTFAVLLWRLLIELCRLLCRP